MRQRAGRAVLALGLVAIVPSLTSPPAAQAAPVSTEVNVQVVDVSPSTPVPSNVKRPLVITLRLTNYTGKAIKGVRVLAQRGDPIGNQRALDASLKNTTPTDGGYDIEPTTPVTVDLPAEASFVQTKFVTSTDIPQDAGICLCHDAVYPLLMSAHTTGTDGTDQLLGSATTYMPSFLAKPKPVRVSWVWPLIDRPHRLLDDTVFTDDDLATTVGTDGRLDRALQVVEAVGPTVPITLVIDPELLDELGVMAAGRYTVQPTSLRKDSAGKAVPVEPVAGTGAVAAAAWLARLRAVLDSDPDVQVELTPYADPDIESLAGADLPWDNGLANQTMAERVSTALGGRSVSNDVAWPPAGVITKTGLESLANTGARTLILDSAAVRPNLEGDIPRSFATLRNDPTITAALTAPALQSYVRSAVTVGGAGTAAMPQLTAELAVRRDEDLTADQFVLLTPPRYVDASVANAVRTIRDTSTSPFTAPISLRSVTAAGDQKATSRLVATAALQTGLSNETLSNITTATTELPTAEQLLADQATSQALRDSYEPALQRVSSAAWRTDSPLGSEAVSTAQSSELYKRLEALFAAVYIVKPSTSSGSYTLASSNSALPITIENDTNFPVKISLDVHTTGGLPGFTADYVNSPVIAPHTKQILHVKTHVERSGRIPVQAQLKTIDGAVLGDPINLSVHSTVLGTVGVVITIVAGAILAIALLLRLIRQWRTRRTRPAGPTRATKRHLVDSQPELAQ